MRITVLIVIVLSGFVGGATAQSIGGSATAFISALVASMVQPGSGAMWSGINASVPQNWSMSDRLFVGNAAWNIPSGRSNTNTTWVPNSTAGAYWLPRDAQMISMATAGTIGIAGLSRASDADSLAGGASTSGVAGYAIGNSATGLTARGGYFELQYASGNFGYGIEIAAKNLSSNVFPDPYSTPSGTSIGLQVGTGDPSYGGANANPTGVGILFPTAPSTARSYNQGLLFATNSLADGKAVSMPVGYQVSWYSGAGALGAQLMAGAGSPAGAVSCTSRCLYLRTDGGAGSTLYVNETGGGTSGWAAK